MTLLSVVIHIPPRWLGKMLLAKPLSGNLWITGCFEEIIGLFFPKDGF